MSITPPDLTEVVSWAEYSAEFDPDFAEQAKMLAEAEAYLNFYDWCLDIDGRYVGLMHPGIIGIFLFHIITDRDDVDDWIWVVVGDLPPTYLTTDICPTPMAVLDGYIGAMREWVDAARTGASVAKLIPVNVLATRENAEELDTRLTFLEERVFREMGNEPKR